MIVEQDIAAQRGFVCERKEIVDPTVKLPGYRFDTAGIAPLIEATAFDAMQADKGVS